MLAARDGTLWIGTGKGLASWKDGKADSVPGACRTENHEASSRIVTARSGLVRLSFPPPGKLCAIHNGSVQCFGEDGSLGYGVVGLFEDSKGNSLGGSE